MEAHKFVFSLIYCYCYFTFRLQLESVLLSLSPLISLICECKLHYKEQDLILLVYYREVDYVLRSTSLDRICPFLSGNTLSEFNRIYTTLNSYDRDRSLKYKVWVGTSKNGKESLVDDKLHAQILDSLLEFTKPETLILATGDGNVNYGGTSFLKCVTRALRLGWHVELYAWKRGIHREYINIQAKHPGYFIVRYLDDSPIKPPAPSTYIVVSVV